MSLKKKKQAIMYCKMCIRDRCSVTYLSKMNFLQNILNRNTYLFSTNLTEDSFPVSSEGRVTPYPLFEQFKRHFSLSATTEALVKHHKRTRCTNELNAERK